MSTTKILLAAAFACFVLGVISAAVSTDLWLPSIGWVSAGLAAWGLNKLT